MLCAECSRCRRKSIIGLAPADVYLPRPADAAGAAQGARLRCDLCGSKDVKLIRVASPAEAVAFVTSRM
ncbi:hypothetical protein J5J86_09110 [Aquabacter sp. L1I39]|uniref:hypothetical protein n=1 Tax=Aquabacter sp. L1I39 TaxID=2820278 RepID=UPI001ADBBD6A|nr:hypothetical protein [Aquabacter sp. L1I39]QTL05421.1 hypothetical protein J5J86_09110 [Aquabacter sp. L1I39]